MKDVTSLARVLAAFLVAAAASAVALADEAAPAPPLPPVAAQCQADLAQQRNVPVAEVQVTRCDRVVWPDAALGLPRPDMLYAQVLTPGFSLTLRARDTDYLYTASDKTFRYGGPMAAWNASALYLEPMADEPNLNSTLLQVGLCGASLAVITTGVTQAFGQRNGALLYKQRTSRSGFDLLYLEPGKTGPGQKLASAFDFSDAVLNQQGTRWAALSRPSLAEDWQLVRGPLASPDRMTTQALPPGSRPSRVYWESNQPLIAVTQDDQPVTYQLAGPRGNRSWVKADTFTLPDSESPKISATESLEVRQGEDGGKPVVTVGRRTIAQLVPVAVLPGATLAQSRLTPDKRFAFITGQVGDTYKAWTVDLTTGEVMVSVAGAKSAPVLLPLAPRAWLQIKGERAPAAN